MPILTTDVGKTDSKPTNILEHDMNQPNSRVNL